MGEARLMLGKRFRDGVQLCCVRVLPEGFEVGYRRAVCRCVRRLNCGVLNHGQRLEPVSRRGLPTPSCG